MNLSVFLRVFCWWLQIASAAISSSSLVYAFLLRIVIIIMFIYLRPKSLMYAHFLSGLLQALIF